MKKSLVIMALLALPSCEVLETAREYSAEVATPLLIAECKLSEVSRKKNAAAITKILRAGGHQYNVVAQDCNPPHDGKPDF